MTWKNRKRLAMVRIQLRKTLKYLLHVGFTVDQTPETSVWFFFSLGLISLNLRLGLCQICGSPVETSEYLSCSEMPIDSADHSKFFCPCQETNTENRCLVFFV